MLEGVAQLLNLHPKSLNKSQQRWHISERELYAMVYGVRKFGQFMGSMVAKWAVTSNKEEWTWNRGQLVVPTPKIVFGAGKEDADLKIFVLNAVKVKMGLHPSPKQDVSSRKEVKFAGLVWTIGGITVGEEGRTHILSVLDREPKGVSQCRTFRGVLVQARSAFKFTAAEIIEFGRLMAPITAAIDAASVKGGKWAWTRECKASTEAFRAKLVDLPKAYTNPDDVLTGDTCLMVLGVRIRMPL